MPDVLVKRSIEQARSRNPLVKAIALLHGSRVLAAMDKEGARRTFEEGVETAESLNLPVSQTEYVWIEAVRLGAFADPLAAFALFRHLPPASHLGPRRSAGGTLVQSLAQSGDFENALTLLEDLHCEASGAQAILHLSSDPTVQRRALAAAGERWRTHRKHLLSDRTNFLHQDVFRLFSEHWRKLEAVEQHIWLDELLDAINTEPARTMRAQFGETIELHSMRDMHLFEILNVLRALKPPDQVEVILQNYPDVENAAKIYPQGLESLRTASRPTPGVPHGFVAVGAGSPPADPLLPTGIIGAQRNDPSTVEDLLIMAHRLYKRDSDAEDRNRAPLVFWPSAHAYRQAMYWAGDRLGLAAEPLLSEIPDVDLVLLAGIELAAGALGLPDYHGVRMTQHSGRNHLS